MTFTNHESLQDEIADLFSELDSATKGDLLLTLDNPLHVSSRENNFTEIQICDLFDQLTKDEQKKMLESLANLVDDW